MTANPRDALANDTQRALYNACMRLHPDCTQDEFSDAMWRGITASAADRRAVLKVLPKHPAQAVRR